MRSTTPVTFVKMPKNYEIKNVLIDHRKKIKRNDKYRSKHAQVRHKNRFRAEWKEL